MIPLAVVCGMGDSTGDATNDSPMKYWEIVADYLSASGWTWGCSSNIDSADRVLFTADAHGHNGKRFIVNADEKMTAFLELKSPVAKRDGLIPIF